MSILPISIYAFPSHLRFDIVIFPPTTADGTTPDVAVAISLLTALTCVALRPAVVLGSGVVPKSGAYVLLLSVIFNGKVELMEPSSIVEGKVPSSKEVRTEGKTYVSYVLVVIW